MPDVNMCSSASSWCPFLVLHQGWLVKSPPLEPRAATLIVKARWRRRWFVLQTGLLPDSYQLEYYTDQSKKKHKGTIPLDKCEQVDAGLTVENGKQRYDFMFDIKIPERIYYLAADTEQDMATWVKKVCNVCGFRSTGQFDDDINDNDEEWAKKDTDADAGFTTMDLGGPSGATAAPTISSPYIHISTCYTGGRPPNVSIGGATQVATTASTTVPQTRRSSHHRSSTSSSTSTTRYRNYSDDRQHELSNYDIGDDSVFGASSAPGDGDGDGNSDYEGPSVSSSKARPAPEPPQSLPPAGGPPSRPPKPPHLSSAAPRQTTKDAAEVVGENYANALEMQNLAIVARAAREGTNTLPAPPRQQQQLQQQQPVPNVSMTEPSHDQNGHGHGHGTHRPPTTPRDLKPGRKTMVHDKSATMQPRSKRTMSSSASLTAATGVTSTGHTMASTSFLASNNHTEAAAAGATKQWRGKQHFATLGSIGSVSGDSNRLPFHAPPVPRGLKPKNTAFPEMDLSSKDRSLTSGRGVKAGRSRHTHSHAHSHAYAAGSVTLPRNYNSMDYSSDDASAISDQSISRRHSFHEQDEEEQIYFYMPSIDSAGGGKYPMMIPADNFEHSSISYIDLDLPVPKGADGDGDGAGASVTTRHRDGKLASAPSFNHTSRATLAAATSAGLVPGGNDVRSMDSSGGGGGGGGKTAPAAAAAAASTAYKKIDFVKTEAFNRTRHIVEEKYKDQT